MLNFINPLKMTPQLHWENSCRLCSEEKIEMLEIFGEEGLRRRVAQKLRVCLPVMVYKSDPLPKQICQFCAARLDDAYEFREHCLNVYKSMHLKLLTKKNLNSVKIFLDAMTNSPDPCQVQLCMIKQRAPPPLVPLPPASISLPHSPKLLDTLEMKESNDSLDLLPELPCEVEIKEEPTDLNTKLGFKPETENSNQSFIEERNEDNHEFNDSQINNYSNDTNSSMAEDNAEGKSILERVLTGNLTINDCKDLNPKKKLSSEWWCSPCNCYYKTKESLVKHMQLCPRKYGCGKCSLIFKSVEELAKHEESYHNHNQLHDEDALFDDANIKEPNDDEVLMQEDGSDNIKRENFGENNKSLTCPTCGKVCTQQSALSNHMRTHEPKKHKCDICGRSFGLFIRLAAHKLSEHNQQPSISSVMASVEQEEALNAEREAREAREAKLKYDRCRTYSETVNDDKIIPDRQRPAKRSASANLNSSKTVTRCGICQQWFNDHTTMLAHLQTHSDNFVVKNFSCSLCTKSFKEKWQLQRHVKLSHKQTKISTYECSVCHKNFPDKTQLDIHEKIHVVDRTYHCSKCNKIFFKELSLATHQCTRLPVFNKRNSSAKCNFNQKELTPTEDEKKYKCPKCPSIFNTPQLRNLHVRIHVEPKLPQHDMDVDNENESMPKLIPEAHVGDSISLFEPKVEISEEHSLPTPMKRTLIRTAGGYRCGVCQSPFVLRELAVAHLRSAHPVMPYQCPYCKKRFTTQYTFTHHIKTDHPNKSEK
ncbi:zinc finger protein 329-like isoform X2 [Chelonus insularis]|uniref:zinc finger protein 329-like isoform X2 n=1 Tax=Chelonus insularis TaxID=460826 RepID=UPI001588D35F|nr:zinc finger protein 329-like isoform X2 [Chelonus insularis]